MKFMHVHYSTLKKSNVGFNMKKQLLLTFILVVSALSVTRAQDGSLTLADKIKRFTPTKITADVSKLSPGDRKALTKLVEAAKLM